MVPAPRVPFAGFTGSAGVTPERCQYDHLLASVAFRWMLLTDLHGVGIPELAIPFFAREGGSEIYMVHAFPSPVKYLYCPQCKELRVKSWYQVRNVCSRCFSVATAIKIPRNWMTYASYVLYVVVPALIGANQITGSSMYLKLAIVGLVVMLIVSYADIVRGEKFARTKIKVAGSNLDQFRKKGWA